MRYVQSQRRSVLSPIERGLFVGLLVASGFIACGSDDSSDGPSVGSGGSDSARGGSTNPGAGESNSEGGKGGTSGAHGGRGGTSSSGGDTSISGGTGGEGGEDGPTEDEDAPGFDGVDLENLGLTDAPGGCIGGFDPDSQTLELSLGKSVPDLMLSVVDGIVTANATPCRATNDELAETGKITTIRVNGGAENNVVYLDASSDFGALLLGSDGGIELDFGEGDDALTVLGSDGRDDIELGTDGESLVVDLNGDGEVDVRAQGVKRALVTTGPQRDRIAADGVALAVDAVTVPLKLFGGGANDELVGGDGDDEIHGGIGDDVLKASASSDGADHYDGGTGRDLVDYSARSAGISITLDDADDDGEAGEGDDVASSVEDVLGSKGPNTITGSADGNHLTGGDSADTIRGGDGDDLVYGYAGNDDLDGENGDDIIYGDEGNDTLQGGPGDDLLDGGKGDNQLDGGSGDGDICIAAGKDTAKACEL
jgi:Ca2+-binding RTX toxin-like protein